MAPNEISMKTKSSAKPVSQSNVKNGKKSPASSKLASLKGAVTKAIFGSASASGSSKTDKKKASVKSTPSKSSKTPPKAAVKAAPKAMPAPAPQKNAKTAAPVKGASPKKTEAPAKAATGKAAPAAAPAVANGKAAKGKGAAAALPRSASKPSISRHLEEICREVACEALSTSGGYCRLHYIKNWKKIKRKELILKEGKLNQYIEELVAKYPDKYIEAIRQDLAEDKAFAKVIYDLDLDESVDEFDVEGEGLEAVIDNIKRDFDDEGETF